MEPMAITILLTAGLIKVDGKMIHVYTMVLTQERNTIRLNFEGSQLGWLNMQVAKDAFVDARETTTVKDETVDPREDD
jgi:hypothetical protein